MSLTRSRQDLISSHLASSLLPADPVLRGERQTGPSAPSPGGKGDVWSSKPRLASTSFSFKPEPSESSPPFLQIWGRSLHPTLSQIVFAGHTLPSRAGSPTLVEGSGVLRG